MRILVFSDSHGRFENARFAISEHPEADVVIFLGDGAKDFEALEKMFPQVFFILRGNCDYFCENPTLLYETISGKRILAAHGHLFHVKYGTGEMENEARRLKADIMLYGHTHVAVNDYRDGLYIMNPGPASGYKSSYGIIDITKDGIMTNIIKF